MLSWIESLLVDATNFSVEINYTSIATVISWVAMVSEVVSIVAYTGILAWVDIGLAQ